jgi:Raf kinase inhibitor-like YbhB/YbcL family protein
MVWVHWVVYNLPSDASGLAEGVKALPQNAKVGLNDWKRAGYGGPCPPIGRHCYFHKLYALNVVLSDGVRRQNLRSKTL